MGGVMAAISSRARTASAAAIQPGSGPGGGAMLTGSGGLAGAGKVSTTPATAGASNAATPNRARRAREDATSR
jgi:hypothetical protein